MLYILPEADSNLLQCTHDECMHTKQASAQAHLTCNKQIALDRIAVKAAKGLRVRFQAVVCHKGDPTVIRGGS